MRDRATVEQLIQNGYNYICFTRPTTSNHIEYDTSSWNDGNTMCGYQTYIFFLSTDTHTITSPFLLTGGAQTHEEYASLYGITSSIATADNVDVTSQYETAQSEIAATLERMNENAIYYNKYLHFLSGGTYECYMGHTNVLTINATNINQVAIEVVSYNNI